MKKFTLEWRKIKATGRQGMDCPNCPTCGGTMNQVRGQWFKTWKQGRTCHDCKKKWTVRVEWMGTMSGIAEYEIEIS